MCELTLHIPATGWIKPVFKSTWEQDDIGREILEGKGREKAWRGLTQCAQTGAKMPPEWEKEMPE
jgi:hypothetical protein